MKTRVMMTMMMTTLRGWRPASTGSYRTCRRSTSLRRVQGLPRGQDASPAMCTKRRRRPATHVQTRPPPLPRVDPFLRHNPFLCLAWAVGSNSR